MPIQRETVNGLQGLLSKVLEISQSLPADGFLWYRGLTCTSFDLLPAIMREGRTGDEVFDREKRLLTRFRQRSMAYWPSGYPQNDWEHLFAMQHYGIPTRLLDFSENLFVATHFALAAVGEHAHSGQCQPIVWCMDPVAWNRSSPGLSEYGDAVHVLTTADDELDAYRPETARRRRRNPIAMLGAHNSARIVAQRGTFVVWGNEPLRLEDFAGAQSATLWGLTIEGDRAHLASELRLIGFSETMVFPELPALSSELTRIEGWR